MPCVVPDVRVLASRVLSSYILPFALRRAVYSRSVPSPAHPWPAPVRFCSGSGTIDYRELNKTLRRNAALGDADGAESTPLSMKATTKIALRKTMSETALSKTLRGTTLVNDGDILGQITSALSKNWGKVRACALLRMDGTTRARASACAYSVQPYRCPPTIRFASPTPQVTGLFLEWDADGNGMLTKRELRKALIVLGLGGPIQHPNGEVVADVAAREAVDRLFDSIDTDHSGEISLHELSRAIRPATKRGAALVTRDPLEAAITLGRSKSPLTLMPISLVGNPPPRRYPRQYVCRTPPEWPQTPACRDVASLMPAHLPASPLISTLGAWQVCVRDRRQLAQASQRLLAAAVDAALLTTARGL